MKIYFTIILSEESLKKHALMRQLIKSYTYIQTYIFYEHENQNTYHTFFSQNNCCNKAFMLYPIFPLEQSLQQRIYVVSYRIILSEQSLKNKLSQDSSFSVVFT